MENNFKQSFEQAAAFQKMWTETLSGMTEVLAEFSPEGPPPETLKQLRSGMLKSITKTLDDYMRTPQFRQTMKQTMDAGLGIREMAQKNMSNLHDQLGSPSKEDIDGILLAIRHIERRILSDIEAVNGKVDKLAEAVAKLNFAKPDAAGKQPKAAKKSPAAGRKTAAKRSRKTP